MKGVLEFDLTDPDDEAHFKLVSKAAGLATAVWDLDQFLRSQVKYNENLSEEEYLAYEKVRDLIRENLRESAGLTMDDLV